MDGTLYVILNVLFDFALLVWFSIACCGEGHLGGLRGRLSGYRWTFERQKWPFERNGIHVALLSGLPVHGYLCEQLCTISGPTKRRA